LYIKKLLLYLYSKKKRKPLKTKTMETIDQKIKKNYITKTFLSKGENCSNESVTMFQVYLNNLPDYWDEGKLYPPAVKKVQEHYGVDYGFGNMIMWGINFNCKKSKTSSKRHTSMNKAYIVAKNLNNLGVYVTDKKLKMVG
jgi:hypothetical protein